MVTTLTCDFSQAASRKAMSSSRPKTWLPVTGNHRNFRRSQSCRRPASSDTRSSRGRLLQALTSDSTPCVDSACYRRHRLQHLVRSLETLCRIFLKEFLKENYDRLWNIFESFTR